MHLSLPFNRVPLDEHKFDVFDQLDFHRTASCRPSKALDVMIDIPFFSFDASFAAES